MVKPITVQFTPRLADHLQSSIAYWPKTLLGKCFRLLAVLFLVLACVLGYRHAYTDVFVALSIAVASWCNVLGLLQVCVTVLMTPGMRQAMTVSFRDDGVLFTTDAGHYPLLWAAFRRFIDSASQIILEREDGTVMTIPKRAFTNGDEIANVQSLAQLKMSPVARKAARQKKQNKK